MPSQRALMLLAVTAGVILGNYCTKTIYSAMLAPQPDTAPSINVYKLCDRHHTVLGA